MCDFDAREGMKQRGTVASKKRRRHTPDQINRKLAEGHKLLVAGKDLGEVCRHLEIGESTWHRWLAQYGGLKGNSIFKELAEGVTVAPDHYPPTTTPDHHSLRLNFPRSQGPTKAT